MPSISQMISFENRENQKSFLIKELKHTKRYDYWSSTSDAMSDEYAWSAGLMYKAYNHTHNKKDIKYIRCVRSDNNISKPYFIRYKNTVVNTTSHTMWQDDTNNTNTTLNYKDAMKYCDSLSIAGFSNWRLPSIKDLRNIVDTTRFNPSIYPIFQNTTNKSYYSSSLYKTKYADVIEFNNGIDGHINKTEKQYVRCIRDIKPTNKTAKINVFFNYDNAVLYIDGKRWGKLHTLLDDYQTTGDIKLKIGIHKLEVKRISKDKRYTISGLRVINLKQNSKSVVVNILATKKVEND